MRRFLENIGAALRNGGLPLLDKELTEQAARKRTYVVRAVYASLLFLITFIFFFTIFSAATKSPLAVLGQGNRVLFMLVGVQFAGSYLFMPAMTCGVITQEKERDSLQFLFLTKLGPWTIIFEKFISRMVPMLGFLLLSLPALAIAYTLGGVSQTMIWSAVVMLVVSVIQAGSVAIMWSAYFRSTVASFLMSYVTLIVLFFGPYFVVMMLVLLAMAFDIQPDQFFGGPSSIGVIYFCLFPFFGLPLYFIQLELPGFFSIAAIATHVGINCGLSAGFLALARRFLVSRAFVQTRNPLASPFQFLRRKQAQPATLELTPGQSELPHSDDDLLPGDRPIVWRETEKQMMGSWSSLRRVFLIVELPTVIVCGLLGIAEYVATRHQVEELVEMLSIPVHGLMWLMAVLLIAVKSSNLIAGERSRQTLDVLSATPMTGRQILAEKMFGVWRLILVMVVPFFTVFLFKVWRLSVFHQRPGRSPFEDFDAGRYLVVQALSMCVLLPLVAWVSLFVGLRLRTQTRAILGAMAAIMVWSLAPLIFVTLPLTILVEGLGFDRSLVGVIQLSTLLSPATIVFSNEVNLLRHWDVSPLLAIVVNFVFYGACLYLIRRLCLSRIDRWLGRLEATEWPARPDDVPQPQFEEPAELYEARAE
jgi:ABC-type transport system involved in multi-copper enzyme maturation permease subunit